MVRWRIIQTAEYARAVASVAPSTRAALAQVYRVLAQGPLPGESSLAVEPCRRPARPPWGRGAARRDGAPRPRGGTASPAGSPAPAETDLRLRLLGHHHSPFAHGVSSGRDRRYRRRADAAGAAFE